MNVLEDIQKRDIRRVFAIPLTRRPSQSTPHQSLYYSPKKGTKMKGYTKQSSEQEKLRISITYPLISSHSIFQNPNSYISITESDEFIWLKNWRSCCKSLFWLYNVCDCLRQEIILRRFTTAVANFTIDACFKEAPVFLHLSDTILSAAASGSSYRSAESLFSRYRQSGVILFLYPALEFCCCKMFVNWKSCV